MQNSSRTLTFSDAIQEALDQMLAQDPNVYIIGEGVPDPKAIFGTTKGLQEKYGKERVYDMPVSENGMTGICIGSAIVGMRPILVHQRVDFTLYALDQVINNAAKWFSMFGGQSSVPIVIRMIIGQGWGQGNQHSQNLQNLYAHIPGLKVVMPSNAYEAKGLLISSIKDNNPVIFIEHRWLHNTTATVPTKPYEIPLGQARILREGTDITIISWSYWTVETLAACQYLAAQGVSAEIVDIRSLSPLDFETIKKSVQKTKRVLVVDGSWKHGGFAGEIIARIAEHDEIILNAPPKRLTYPDFPSPSTPGLAKYYYPTQTKIFHAVSKILNTHLDDSLILEYEDQKVHDIPDKNFTGPF